MGDVVLRKVVVLGGTGLVGTRLVAALARQGAQVAVVSRTPARADLPRGAAAIPWEDLPAVLEGADAVVNLAGEGIAEGRWTSERRRRILESRTLGTRRLVEALAAVERRPGVLVNASAVGYYGNRPEEVDELAPGGRGFLAEVCAAWEAEARRAAERGLRVVLLRTGVVLAREGGALPRMVEPIRFFAGASLGSGRQGLSWIHVDDLVRLILEAARNPAYAGPVNATAPAPLSNGAFTRLLARRLHRPVWPVPGFLTALVLRLILGPMGREMLLEGAFVQPRAALDRGFVFKFPRLEDALADLLDQGDPA